MTQPVLETRNLAASYGRLPVLFDVSMQVHGGEIVVVSAGNGAGKSTLLSAISGLLRPLVNGSVRFNGTDVTTKLAHRTCRLGLIHVLERRRLAPFMSVNDNLKLSQAALSKDQRSRWKADLARFGQQPLVQSHGNRMAGELSGGQQQLIALLRGLLCQPKLLLLDEPFQGLDRGIAAEVVEVLRSARAEGLGIVLTEHRAEIVEGLADRTLRLERGEIVEELVH
jgi:ABC-type branched-subunit amino acid transport system ATPase component